VGEAFEGRAGAAVCSGYTRWLGFGYVQFALLLILLVQQWNFLYDGQNCQNNPLAPYPNKAISGNILPVQLIKLIVAAAALEEGHH